MEVVGVVGDVRQQPDAEAKSEMYVPYAQYPDNFLRRMYANVTLVVADAPGNPAPLASSLREIVREIDPDQPVANVRTLDDGALDVGVAAALPHVPAGVLRADRADAGGDRRLRPAGARRGAARERVRRADGARRVALDGAGARPAAGPGARRSPASAIGLVAVGRRGARAATPCCSRSVRGIRWRGSCPRARCWPSHCSRAGSPRAERCESIRWSRCGRDRLRGPAL